MKKLSYLIVLALVLGLVLTGCSLLSNIGQAPATEQSGITYLTKGVPPGLVGLWHFDGDALDSSGNSNDGTLHNFVSPHGLVSGMFGQALSFDGVDDYVECEKNVDITTAITVEAWIKPSAFTDYDAIVTNFEWPTDPEGWSFRVMSNKKLVWRAVLSGNNTYSIISNSTMEADNWYHVVLTHDASYTRLYINGSLDKEETPGGTIVNLAKALKIGWDDYAVVRVFNGIIDEVRIWDTVLTADQLILYEFDGLFAPYKEPPKAFKIGRSIPLKWQFTDLLSDSSAANPSVEIKPVVSNGITPVEGTPIVVDDPGSSGYQYDSETNTWQFNWQTKDCDAGDYNIWIINDWTGQTFGPFLILLR